MYIAAMVGMLSSWAVTGGSPYNVDPAFDVPLTVGVLAVVGLEETFVKPSLSAPSGCVLPSNGAYCDKSHLNSLDRSVVGNYSKTWLNVSDVGQYGALALPIAASSLDAWLSGSDTGLEDAATDSLVVIEAATFATLMSTMVKLATRRPRPGQYVADRAGTSIEDQLSFPSGHTTATAAATTAYATTFWLRHPDSPARYVVTAGAVAMTGAVGYARVAGGMHFYIDVLAGAVMGGVTGWLVPLWHRADRDTRVAVSPLPGGGLVALTLDL